MKDKETKLKFSGLVYLAQYHYKQMLDIEISMGELLDIEDDGTGYRGKVSDELWGGFQNVNINNFIKK